jgi:hypothetical protein
MEFLRKADGVDIFPKIPAMLKAEFGRWNKTSRINMAVRELNDHGYTELLKKILLDALQMTLFCTSIKCT